DGAQCIHEGGNADLDKLGLIPIAMGDVSRRNVRRLRGWPGHLRRPWHGRLVSSVEDKVGGIKVEAIEGQFGELDDLGGDSREDRVAFGKGGVKGSAQAVVVQALGVRAHSSQFAWVRELRYRLPRAEAKLGRSWRA